MDLLSQETWRFINTFAPWLSAVGSIAAVITSLYFSRKNSIVDLEVFADCRSYIVIGSKLHFNSKMPNPDAVVVYVTNVGQREAVIDQVVWKSGILFKRRAVQSIERNEWTSQLPKKLNDGDIAHYVFPMSDYYNWVKTSGVTFVGRFPWIQSFFIKVQIRTSIGKHFEARIGPELRRMIVAEARKRD